MSRWHRNLCQWFARSNSVCTRREWWERCQHNSHGWLTFSLLSSFLHNHSSVSPTLPLIFFLTHPLSHRQRRPHSQYSLITGPMYPLQLRDLYYLGQRSFINHSWASMWSASATFSLLKEESSRGIGYAHGKRVGLVKSGQSVLSSL